MNASLSLMLPRPVVELSEVSKRFGRLRVLHRVCLDIRAGRVTAILGPNAAGKSTVIKLILGLTRCDAGRVLVNGQPAPIFFSGLAPGLVGVYQINVYLPSDAPEKLEVTVR